MTGPEGDIIPAAPGPQGERRGLSTGLSQGAPAGAVLQAAAALCVPRPGSAVYLSSLLFLLSHLLHRPLLAFQHRDCPSMADLCSLPHSTTLSGFLSVCFASKAPRGSIGLAGQTLGSGPCSRARLLTAAPGQDSQVWSPQLWSEPWVHGGAGTPQKSSRLQESWVHAGVSSEPLSSRVPQRCQVLSTLRESPRRVGTEAGQSEHCSQNALCQGLSGVQVAATQLLTSCESCPLTEPGRQAR